MRAAGHVFAMGASRERRRAADRRPSVNCLVGSGGRERRAPNVESCRCPKRVEQTEHGGHSGRVSRVAAGEDESIGLSLQQRGWGSTVCNVGGEEGGGSEAVRTLEDWRRLFVLAVLLVAAQGGWRHNGWVGRAEWDGRGRGRGSSRDAGMCDGDEDEDRDGDGDGNGETRSDGRRWCTGHRAQAVLLCGPGSCSHVNSTITVYREGCVASTRAQAQAWGGEGVHDAAGEGDYGCVGKVAEAMR
jgi:hypothetical protein